MQKTISISKRFLLPRAIPRTHAPNSIRPFASQTGVSVGAVRPKRFESVDPKVTKDLYSVSLDMLRQGRRTSFPVYAPIHPVSDNAREVEQINLDWAKGIKLYGKKYFNTLENTGVASLIDVCYPVGMTADIETFILADQWMRMLFSIDDTVDSHKMSSQELRKFNDKKEGIISGAGQQNLEHPKLQAINEIYSKHRERFSEDFKASFLQYLRSVEYELQLRESNVRVNSRIIEMHRPYASGACHAIKMGFSFQGIDYAALEEKYFALAPMLADVSLHIGWINDVFSWEKEYDTDSYSLNVVDLYIKKGKTVEESMGIVLNNCNKLIENFYNNKAILMERVDAEDREDVGKAVETMEAWLSQLFWAVNVPRYNQSAKLSKTDNSIRIVMGYVN
jgi:hypothetical protein